MVNNRETVNKHKWGIRVFAVTEILVGTISFAAIISSIIQGKSTKPLEVVIFVLTTAIISASLGFGILRYSLNSYHLLLFLSTVIIFSKILIFAKIISLSGALETAVPSSFKNIVSIVYHSLIIFYFTRKPIKKQFGEHRNVIFSLKMPFLKETADARQE